MTTITNDTIIKAAKAAGLDVRLSKDGISLLIKDDLDRDHIFEPQVCEVDNCMIMDGAEISVSYSSIEVSASCFIGCRAIKESGFFFDDDSKKEARRNAIILCAAANTML